MIGSTRPRSGKRRLIQHGLAATDPLAHRGLRFARRARSSVQVLCDGRPRRCRRRRAVGFAQLGCPTLPRTRSLVFRRPSGVQRTIASSTRASPHRRRPDDRFATLGVSCCSDHARLLLSEVSSPGSAGEAGTAPWRVIRTPQRLCRAPREAIRERSLHRLLCNPLGGRTASSPRLTAFQGVASGESSSCSSGAQT